MRRCSADERPGSIGPAGALLAGRSGYFGNRSLIAANQTSAMYAYPRSFGLVPSLWRP
jgi:hypothetical protein